MCERERERKKERGGILQRRKLWLNDLLHVGLQFVVLFEEREELQRWSIDSQVHHIHSLHL